MSPLYYLFGGGALLYFGAEWFVGGASALARALRIPQVIVGLTVVAYGTSAPEIVVGIQAASAGHGSVALGNVLGSNIANIGLILALAVLVRPAKVDASFRHRELPMLLGSSLLLPYFFHDDNLGVWEAFALLVAAAAYTGAMIKSARSSVEMAANLVHVEATSEAAEESGAPHSLGAGRAALVAALGLGVMLLGGTFFIDGSIAVARILGMSDRMVGLTIVAIGTSFPELVTSVIAARRGHSNLAIGNVVGSNIFNSTLCLGAAGLFGTVNTPFSTIAFDLLAMLGMTAALAFLVRRERIILRREGASLLAAFILFTLWTIARG